MRLRRNASRDEELIVLFDAIEEDNRSKIVPLFEEFYGGPPSPTRLFSAAVDALHLERPDQARQMFDEGWKMFREDEWRGERWAAGVPPELQAWVPFTTNVVRAELARATGVHRRRIELLHRGVNEMTFTDPDAEYGVVQGDDVRRWTVYRNRAAAVRAAQQNQYEDNMEDLLMERHRYSPQQFELAKRAASADALHYAESALGEALGISPGHDGDVTLNGFWYFDQARAGGG